MATTNPQDADLENTLYMELDTGRVTIKLLPDVAPKHVARVKELVRDGFYDGLTFHRVIAGFMAQTGCPQGTGTGGTGSKLAAEFSRVPFERGTVGAARTADPNSADSQFFICFGPASHLNGQYTVWGQVSSGMKHIDKLNVGEPPRQPSQIKSIRVAADA